eukprot:31203-Pelagococcus_subviridis.AAC.4
MPAAHAFALGAAARVAFPRASRRPRTPARASSSDDASPPPPPARKGNPGELRLLGDSDLMISEICLGTMTFGKQNTERDAHAQLSYAVDAGVNFIDTAEMYPVPTEAARQGKTDEYIGTWLRSRRREDVVLATKVSGRSDRITWLPRGDNETPRVKRKHIMESVEHSLSRLQVDHIDLLQIHWPDRYVSLFGASPYDVANVNDDDVPFEEQLRAFDDLIRQGKVRHLGVSNETSWGVCEFARIAATSGMPKLVSIQNSYSLLTRGAFETDLAEVCSPSNANVGLLAYSPLAGGALTGKYLGESPPEGARFTMFPGYMERFNKSATREATAEYARVAGEYGLSPAALALAFVRSRWFVTSTIIGATSMEQLGENIDAFNVEMTQECLDDIDAVYKKYKDPAIS